MVVERRLECDGQVGAAVLPELSILGKQICKGEKERERERWN